MSPFVLMADIDKAVIKVTIEHPKIIMMPSTENGIYSIENNNLSSSLNGIEIITQTSKFPIK